MSKRREQEGYGIIGLGRFGMTLAQELAEAGHDVLVIDENESKIRQARNFTDAAFVTDSLDKETLTQCGIPNCDTVIVCIGEKIDTSILTTLTVIQLGVRRVVSKAISDDQGAVLEKLGAEVVFPESDMAKRLAKRLTTKRVLDFLALSGDIEISEMRVSGPIEGKTVAQLDFRRRFGLNIIAIICADGVISTDITPDSVLHAQDAVVVVGRKENLEKFERFLSKEG